MPSENSMWTNWWIKIQKTYFKNSCESTLREILIFVLFLNLIQVHQFTWNLRCWSLRGPFVGMLQVLLEWSIKDYRDYVKGLWACRLEQVGVTIMQFSRSIHLWAYKDVLIQINCHLHSTYCIIPIVSINPTYMLCVHGSVCWINYCEPVANWDVIAPVIFATIPHYTQAA